MKKKVSMKKKIIISVIILFVVTVLSVGGYVLFSFLQPAVELEDTDALYQTTLKETPNDGSKPEDYSIEDNISFALYKLSHTDEFYSITSGEALAAGVNQTVSNARVVKGEKAMVTMITSGFIENAKQRYFMNDKVLMRNAVKITSPTTADWSTNEPECVTYAQIKHDYGWFPFDTNGYIICEDTFINKDQMELKVNEDGTYTLIFDLDPSDEKAPFWYRREIITNSGSTKPPVFLSIHLELTIDDNWTILKSEIKESYKVTKVIEAVTSTHCVEEFFYDNVEFDKDAYDFFESYSYLQAQENLENEEEKVDKLGIIVESLQDKNGYTNLELDLNINGTKIKGLLALDINDIENVKVKAKLEDIYVEYSDNLYLSIGGLKVYSSMDDLSSLIDKVLGALPKGEGEGISLDVNKILDDFAKANLVEEDNKVIIDANLNLLGIELPLHFEIDKVDETYRLAKANIICNIEGIDINASIVKTNKTINNLDKKEFVNLNNLDFIIDDVVNIINDKKLDFKAELEYQDIKVDVLGNVDFNNDLALSVRINLSYKEKDFLLKLNYIDDVVYLDLANIHLKANKADLFDLISKYSDINISLDTSNLDIEGIINTIFSIDFDKLIKEFILTDNSLNVSLDLSDLTDLIDDIKLELNDTNYGLTGKISLKDFLIDLSLGDLGFIKEDIDTANYKDISTLSGLIDSVVDIAKMINNQSIRMELDGNINISNISIELNGNIDLLLNDDKYNIVADLMISKDNISHNLKVMLIDNMLYVSYDSINIGLDVNDIDWLTELISKFGVETNVELDITKVLDLVDTIELINNGISVDLSSLLDLIGKVFVSLDKNNDSYVLSITSDLLSLDGIINKIDNYDIVLPTEYFDSNDIKNLEFIVDEIVNILDKKNVDLRASLSIKGFDISLFGNIDFSDGLDLSLKAFVEYKNNELALNINYIDDVLYVDLANIHLMATKDDLFTLINSFLENDINLDESLSLDIESIIDLVFSIDVDKLIKEFVVSESSLLLDLDLSDLTDLINNLKLELNDTLNGLNGNISIDDMIINVEIGDLGYVKEDIDLDSYDDISMVSNLITNIVEIVKLINNESLSIAVEGSINISDILIDLSGNIDLVLEDKQYIVKGSLDINVLSTINHIDIIYKNKMLYITYGSINIGLDISDINTFLEEALTRLGLDFDMSFDLSKVFDLIDTLTLTNNGISVDLSSIIELINQIDITLVKNDDKYDMNISGDDINLSLVLSTTNPYDINLPTDYLDNEDILIICSHIGNILELIKNNSFELELDLSIFENNNLYLNILGSIQFIIDKEEGKEFSLDDLSIKVEMAITEYQGNSIKVRHRIDLTWVGDYIYIVYGNNENNQASKIKLYAKKNSILSVIASLLDVLDINISLFDEYKDTSLEHVDFSQLTDLFKMDSSNIDIASIIKSLGVDSNGITLNLNLHGILDFIPDNMLATVLLSTTNTKLNLEIENLYIDYVSASENKMINLDVLSLEAKDIVIDKPTSVSDYYDISDIDKLIVGLLTTASNKDYALSGNVYLSILNWIDINVSVDAKIRVLEDGSPLIYVHLGVPSFDAVVVKLTKKDVYYYYQDGYVYLNRVDSNGDVYNIKVTYQEFFSDIIYYLLDLGMGMPDIVLSNINLEKDNSDYVIDAGKVLKNYKYTTNKFSFTLDMKELTGDSNLGDMSLALNLSTVGVSKDEFGNVNTSLALTSISDFSMKLVKLITLNMDSLSITNLKNEYGYTWFTSIEMGDVLDYIANYKYGVDMIYLNGNYKDKIGHSVTFVKDDGTPDTVFNGQVGMTITFPNLETKEEDGKYYLFDGWYTDKYKTDRFMGDSIPENDLILYAKWKEINYYNLSIHTIDGDVSTSIYGGASLEEYYGKTTYTIDGVTYLFRGYSLTNGGELIDIRLMPENDLELYAVWDVIGFKVYVDGSYYMDLETDTNLALTKNYALVAGDIYLEFEASDLNYDTLVNMYSKYSIENIDGAYFYLVSVDSIVNSYRVELNVSNSFDDKLYVAIILPNDKELDYSLLPNKLYNHMNINYWFNENGDYHKGNINTLVKEDQVLYAYYSLAEYLSFGYDSSNGDNLLSITGFSYTGSSAIDLILPKYVYINGNYEILGSIATYSSDGELYSPFSSKNNIKSVYFNEGFTIIGNNAFKNCTSLTKVYLSKTITTIKNDAFYYSVSSTFETNRDYALALTIYKNANSSLDTSNLLACKWYSTEKYYGVSNSGLFGMGKVDLSNTFKTNNLLINYLVNSLF